MAFIDLNGPVHFVDHGGEGPVIVLVHGLGGSHLNWVHVADQLAAHHRVYALDLIGFGLTPPEGRKATVQANRDLVMAFADEVSPADPVVLVGNSMGGLVTMLTAAKYPGRVASLVLVNPALPTVDIGAINAFTMRRLAIPLLPWVGERSLRSYNESTTPEQQLDQTLQMVAARPDALPCAGREASIALLAERREMDWAIPSFIEASRSIAGVLFRRGNFRKMVGSIECPALLMHGALDRIVSPGSASWLAAQRPDWTFELLQGVGHVPQLEVPDVFVDLVETFLSGS